MPIALVHDAEPSATMTAPPPHPRAPKWSIRQIPRGAEVRNPSANTENYYDKADNRSPVRLGALCVPGGWLPGPPWFAAFNLQDVTT